MAWKKDDSGNFAVDNNGNPVWVTDTGEDKSVDYLAMSKSIRDANFESKNRKDEIRGLKEKLAIFDGIEDLSVWKDEAIKAIEAQKNAPDKDKELEVQIASRIESATNSLKAQMSEKDRKLGEKDKAIKDLTAQLNNMKVRTEVQASKILNERIKPEDRPFIRRELERAGAVDADGKVFFHYDDGSVIYGDNGLNATADEAITQIIEKLGIDPKTKLLSQDDTTGSGGNANQNGKFNSNQVNPWKKETWNLTEQMKITNNDPALAQRLKQAAGL